LRGADTGVSPILKAFHGRQVTHDY
jgi:hypothetical protein